MKLPSVLSRLRRKSARVDTPSPPPVATSPAVPPAPPRPAPLERLNRWLTLGANIGVVFGLVILIVEVRQNAAMTRAAMEQQKNNVLAGIELNIASPEISEIWVKSVRHPEDLTDSEIRTMDGILAALMLQWEHRFQMESAGLARREDSRQYMLNAAPYYFGSRFAKNWWAFQANGWEGTPMMDVAGPIIEATDENFLANYLDKLKLSASEELTPDPEMPE